MTPAACSFAAYWSPLVAQRVESGGDHQRRRQPGQVAGQQRRDPRIRVVDAGALEVAVLEPVHVVFGQQESVPEQGSGAGQATHVGGRVDQPLQRGRWSTGVARPQGDQGGQVAAGAVAADRDAAGVGAEFRRVPRGPTGRRRTRRPRRPGPCARAPAGSRRSTCAAASRQMSRHRWSWCPGRRSPSRRRGRRPAGGGPGAGGPVVPHRDLSGRTGDGQVAYLGRVHARLVHRAGRLPQLLAGGGHVVGDARPLTPVARCAASIIWTDGSSVLPSMVIARPPDRNRLSPPGRCGIS